MKKDNKSDKIDKIMVNDMKAISIKDLTFRYNKKRTILKNLNLDIEEGEYVVLLGHNGSGKSTLAKLIIGLLEKNSGSITINDIELNEENVYKIRENVGIVFQNPDNQFVGVTVKDDIAFGLENRRVQSEDIKKRVLEVSKLVGMDQELERNPEELSGGQKQRVAIASVLAFKPKIIIFDEATSMLDPAGVKEVLDTIRSLVGKITILSITHNLNEAKDADRVIVLNKGAIVLDGKPQDVFKEKEILKSANLDITNAMRISELINSSSLDSEKKKIVEGALWELTFQK